MAPRMGQRRRQAPKLQPVAAPPRDAKPGDNSKAIREAEAAQLLSYLAAAREKKGVVDKARAAVKSAQDDLNEVFRLAKAAGFQRQELSELMEDMSSPERRRNLQDEEQRRARFRRICGLPVGDEGAQADLEDRMPETAKDAMFYQGMGYTAGVAGEAGKPPSDVPSQFIPEWMKGWGDGQTILAQALARPPEKPAPKPKPAAEPATIADERIAEKREEKAAREALDNLSAGGGADIVAAAETELEDAEPGDPNEDDGGLADQIEESELEALHEQNKAADLSGDEPAEAPEPSAETV